ncbi:YcxB family protein [Chryseobacterium sp.]|uniref:YcxB family protein n=1 Tax=Chryseobacterium sp. TaxID=1871047 RepID=UPI001624CAE1|nr:YcxB family protein [Chryseobacterium sp.]
MTLQFSLDETDYLNYQLFTASKSRNIIKKRQRNRFLLPVFFIVLGLFPRFDLTERFAQIYILIALLWLLLYPLWEKKMYINHFKKHITEHHKNNFGRTSTLEFEERAIIAKDENSESKISFNEFEQIDEVPSAIYIKLKSGQSIILPKKSANNIDEIKVFLRNLSNDIKIKYIDDNEWKWK